MEEPIVEKDPARALLADVQKEGGIVTHTKDKMPSPDRSDPKV
jgi:hypothetical protein